MEVSQKPFMIASHVSSGEEPLALKVGDVYSASIKEWKSAHEAIVTIKGNDVHVQFTSSAFHPDNGTMKLQIQAIKNGTIEASIVPNVSSRLQQGALPRGMENFHGLEAALTILKQKGIPVTGEAIEAVATFLKTEKAPLSAKLQTIEMAVKKDISLTAKNLEALHSALNGRPFSELLVQLEKELQRLSIGQEKPSQLQSLDQEVIRITDEAIKQFAKLGNSLARSSGPGDVLLSVPEELGLHSSKNALAGNRTFAMEMENVTAIHKSDNNDVFPLSLNAKEAPALGPFQSKDIVIHTVTARLSRLAQDFKQMQREVVRSLNHVEPILGQGKNAAVPAKQLLETVIQKIDQSILKSDMMLFADMETEKALMEASSRLAEAKQFVQKGDMSSSGQIVKQVQAELEKINWQPGITKVQHFVAEELFKAPSPSSFLPVIDDAAEASPRHMFEKVRQLGFNHESDVARHLLSIKESATELPENIKSSLIKLANEQVHSKAGQLAETALTHLAGQQLLAKTESSGISNLLFQLPFVMNDEVKNVKIVLNSRNSGEKVDWENCSLYFLLETKKLGEVGITISVVNRKLSITIKNDKEAAKEKLEPLAKEASIRLKEIGYHVSSIQFSPLNEKKESPSAQATHGQEDYSTDKGLNITV